MIDDGGDDQAPSTPPSSPAPDVAQPSQPDCTLPEIYDEEAQSCFLPFFDDRTIELNIPQEVWAAENDTYIQHVDVVDLNNDGLLDIVIHQGAGWEASESLSSPSKDSLVVFLQTAASEYVLANEAVFGKPFISFGAASTKRVVADFNGDGFADIAYALNREDGRPLEFISTPTRPKEFETQSSWAAPQQVVMSNGDGTYRVDVLDGDPIWQHGIATVTLPSGQQDLIYGSYAFPDSANVYRYQNSAWQNVDSYPYLNGWDMVGSRPEEVEGREFSRYFMSSSQGPDANGEPFVAAQVFQNESSGWVFLDEYRFGDYVKDVRFDWYDNKETSTQPMFEYLGMNRMSFVLTQSCSLLLHEDKSIFIAMLDSQIVPDDFVEPVDLASLQPTQIYIPLSIEGGDIIELDILDEQDEFTQDVYFSCNDVTGNGLGDLVIFDDERDYGLRLFINDGAGDLVQTDIQGLDVVRDPNLRRAIFIDVNGDGIGDLVQYYHHGLRVNYGNRPQVIDSD